jgi:very-short-patch-repair endonuclease
LVADHRRVLPDVDRIARYIGKLAGRQYGHVTRAQLLAAGLSSAAIGRWTASGRLIRSHAGVYAVGHARAEPVARAAAALLACGDRAVLSHETAAALWGFRSRWPLVPEVSGATGRLRPGIVHHKTRTLTRRDVRRHRGLRVTSPARTLDDIKARLTPAEFVRAINDARLSGVLNGADVERFTPRQERPTRSAFEDQVAAELRDRGFPEPRVNASVLGFEVDFLFPDHQVIVELDGWAYHSDHPTWERDRTRDTVTAAAGFVTLRITWLRWQEDRAGVLSQLAAVLAGRLAR